MSSKAPSQTGNLSTEGRAKTKPPLQYIVKSDPTGDIEGSRGTEMVDRDREMVGFRKDNEL